MPIATPFERAAARARRPPRLRGGLSAALFLRHPLHGELLNATRECRIGNELVALRFSDDDDDDGEMKLRVVCYSGRKGDERPLRFQLGDREYRVEEIVDQWYGPDDAFFRVRACDGNLYVLRRRSSTPEGEWSLDSFRDPTRGG